jgi:probable rRNA maturation factor
LIGRYRERCGVPRQAVVEVTVADDALLAELNREYRRREGPTDVLAFPIGRDPVEPEEIWLWGEVYVSIDRAREQAERRGVALDEELVALVAHGLLHLAGYDDDNDEARAEMERAAHDLTAEAD